MGGISIHILSIICLIIGDKRTKRVERSSNVKQQEDSH